MSQELFFAVTAWFFISFCLGVYEHLPDLRHSVATLLLQQGFSLKQIQEWLGHADIATTANVYAHVPYVEKLSIAKGATPAIVLN